MKNSLATMMLVAAALMPAPFASAQADQGPAHPPSFSNAVYSQANAMPALESAFSPTKSDTGPDTTTAWLMAMGFLGMVMIRRTRSPL